MALFVINAVRVAVTAAYLDLAKAALQKRRTRRARWAILAVVGLPLSFLCRPVPFGTLWPGPG